MKLGCEQCGFAEHDYIHTDSETGTHLYDCRVCSGKVLIDIVTVKAKRALLVLCNTCNSDNIVNQYLDGFNISELSKLRIEKGKKCFECDAHVRQGKRRLSYR